MADLNAPVDSDEKLPQVKTAVCEVLAMLQETTETSKWGRNTRAWYYHVQHRLRQSLLIDDLSETCEILAKFFDCYLSLLYPVKINKYMSSSSGEKCLYTTFRQLSQLV